MSNKPGSHWNVRSLPHKLPHYFSKKELLVIGIFIVIFLGASAFSGLFSSKLRQLFAGKTFYGLWPYVLMVIFGELVLPGSSLPLLPIMVMLRGGNPTAWATLVGWMASAVIAFAVARHLRGRLMKKVFSEETLEKIGESIPRQHLFWSTVLFRMVFPVGPASYALALFTRMGWFEYLLASLAGLVPYSFALVWVSTWPRSYRLIADSIGILATAATYIWLRSRVMGQLRRKPQE